MIRRFGPSKPARPEQPFLKEKEWIDWRQAHADAYGLLTRHRIV